MTRSLKNLMKAKKPMWRCGECKCVTLQCWRDNDEFCNCGTSSEGLGVEYVFKNWNGTILKKWSVDEWATPKAPADPTREATAQYTYTFAGWDPEVGPISEDTVYTATYTSTVNQYTVSIAPNDVSYGTVDENSITVDYGTAISVVGNVLTIGEIEVTATAESGYEFTSWWTLPETVTENLSITATFSAVTPPASWFNIVITSSTWNIYNDSEELQELPVIVWFNEWDEVTAWASTDVFSMRWNVWEDEWEYLETYWAFPFEWGDEFSHWEMDWVPMEDEAEVTITSTTTITAVFWI